MLSPYQVLDFTDERGLLCSKIPAELGADVLQVEPPTGSSARRIGPFYQDQVHAERSLYWWFHAANKRGITLNTETLDGQALLVRLAASADFAITAGTPSELEAQGPHHEHLMALNPELMWCPLRHSAWMDPMPTTRHPTLSVWDWAALCMSRGIPIVRHDSRPPADDPYRFLDKRRDRLPA
jgi:crotonobetainyl-CoA:carnitine CoA-transferase CaiB-like acyl-CoA transferase